MNLASNLFNPILVVGILLLIFIISDKKEGLIYYMLYFGFSVFLASVLKSWLSSPRPYWVDPDIKQLEWYCYQEFGDPSGHALLGVMLFDFLIEFLIFKRDIKKYNKLIFTVCSLSLLALMLFSRVYLGMHTYGQVLLGLCIGTYLIILYKFFIQDRIKQFIQYIQLVNRLKQKCTPIIITTYSFIAFILISLITYYIQSNNNKNSKSSYILDVWQQNIKTKCGLEEVHHVKMFYSRCFTDSGVVSIIFSIFFGMIFTKHPEYYCGKLKHHPQTFRRRIEVIVVSLLINIVPLSLSLLHSLIKDNAYLIFFVQLIFMFGEGISLIIITPIILLKYKLVKNSNPDEQQDFDCDDDNRSSVESNSSQNQVNIFKSMIEEQDIYQDDKIINKQSIKAQQKM